VRQGQQNRRGRGRNNRKGHNPLSRSFESNGPDVKIRGTPAHIAEKYLALSRDAQSSGDPVLAENYLQHAEHYTRIIMAYREQLQQPGEPMNGGAPRMRPEGEPAEEFADDDGGEEALDEGFQPPQPHFAPPQQHPRQHGGYEGRHEGRHDRPYRRDHGRFRDRDRDRDRHGGEGRPPQDRPQQPERYHEPTEAGDNRRRDKFQEQHQQPDFLRRPVRRSRTENGDAAPPPKDEPSRE
jgi:hypothetical protein